MPSHDWTAFLTRWSQEIITEERPGSDLPPEAIESGWLGLPPASEDQIAAAEARLGVKLPPSYREFLGVSNGWRFLANPYVEVLRPGEELEYFPVRNRQWITSMDLFSDAESRQELYGFTDGELEGSIELTESREGTMLLNPRVITPDGEMEAWFFESEGGVERFPSFWAVMQDDFKLYLSFKAHDSRQLKSGKQVETVTERFPGLIAELEEKADQWRGVQRTHPTELYQSGILAVIDETLEALRKMQAGQASPEALLDQVRSLTESMEQTWNNTWPKQQGTAAFLKGLADPAKTMYEGGRTEGMRETIGILRWFLNEGPQG